VVPRTRQRPSQTARPSGCGAHWRIRHGTSKAWSPSSDTTCSCPYDEANQASAHVAPDLGLGDAWSRPPERWHPSARKRSRALSMKPPGLTTTNVRRCADVESSMRTAERTRSIGCERAGLVKRKRRRVVFGSTPTRFGACESTRCFGYVSRSTAPPQTPDRVIVARRAVLSSQADLTHSHHTSCTRSRNTSEHPPRRRRTRAARRVPGTFGSRRRTDGSSRGAS
jgi:hypothetical protein